MAQDKVAVPNELAVIQSLASLLGGGGQTVSTSAGNTAALQNVINQLQATDYNNLLQGIFQQAAGNIPGLQAAYGRAVGARSSGNAPMQAALQQLLQQTTLAGQQQVASQQLNNAQVRTQAGQGIAQATRGTTQKTAQNSQLGQIAGLVGLLQGATKLTGAKTVQEMLGNITGTSQANAQQSPNLSDYVGYGTQLNQPIAESPYASFQDFSGPAYTPGESMSQFDQLPLDFTPADTTYNQDYWYE